MVKFLLKRGLDLDINWECGQKALWCAASRGYESIIRILVA